MVVRLTLLILLVFSLGVSSMEVSNDISQGIKAYEDDDYDKAFNLLEGVKAKDSMTGLFYLGVMYYQGFGTKENEGKGVKLIREVADLGYKDAKYYLSKEVLFQHTDALNFQEAVKMLTEAADLGQVGAAVELGWLYYSGYKTIKKDDKAAFKYFKLSADIGYPNAFYPMALIYSDEKSSYYDKVSAYTWAALAERFYDRQAPELRIELESKLSKSEKEAAIKKGNEMIDLIEKNMESGLLKIYPN